MKKLFALLLAVIMVISMFAACTPTPGTEPSNNPTEPSNNPTEPSNDTTDPTEPPVVVIKNVDRYPLECDKTFTVVTTNCASLQDAESTIITERIEEATGVKIDWLYMTKDQLNLAITSGDIPDALFLAASALNKSSIYEYGEAGVFVNFMDYLEYMPNLAAIFEADPSALAAVQNEDGSVYVLPQHTLSNTGANNMIYYRTDMMKEIGWEKAPSTTDEFIQYCKDLQAYYGKNDPDFIAYNAYAPNIFTWNAAWGPQYFFASFGELVVQDIQVNSKGEVVVGAATEQFRHYLEFMNELWNTGAFNTNIYTQDATASQALNAEGHVAISGRNNGFSAKDENGNLALDVMAPLTSVYWSTQHWYLKSSWGVGNCMLNAKCEDIITMCKWFDAFYAPYNDPLNEEGTLWGAMSFLGAAGVDVELDEETLIYTVLDHETVDAANFLAKEGFGQSLFNGWLDGFPYSQALTTTVGVKGAGTVAHLWPYAETPIVRNDLALDTDEGDVYNEKWPDINTYIGQMTAKFISGELEINDTNWNNYLSELKKMGLDEVIEVYTAAYERYLENKK